MHSHKTAAPPAALLAALALLVACSRTATLQVPPGAAQPAHDGEATVSVVDGVEVVVRPDAWSGMPIKEHVTPLQATIRNDGDRPLKLRYESFALVADDGQRYNALPPLTVKGQTVTRGAPLSPAFRHSYFHVAPHFGHHYAGLPVTPHPFHHHSRSYRYYYGYWDALPLPTERMLEQAIPEGVLDPGGSISGFLYFEPVSPDERQVTFRASLTDAAREDTFGEIRIPLLVEDG